VALCGIYKFQNNSALLEYVIDKISLKASNVKINTSLDLENTCVQLRAATFFLINMEFSESIKICDRFLTFPPRQKIDGSYREYAKAIEARLFQLFKMKATEEIERILKAILPMSNGSIGI
jgi:hypothetical protein